MLTVMLTVMLIQKKAMDARQRDTFMPVRAASDGAINAPFGAPFSLER
jgi:hypothetical protein